MWPEGHEFDMLDLDGQGNGRTRLRYNDKGPWERGITMGASAGKTEDRVTGEALCHEKGSIRTQTLILHLWSLGKVADHVVPEAGLPLRWGLGSQDGPPHIITGLGLHRTAPTF